MIRPRVLLPGAVRRYLSEAVGVEHAREQTRELLRSRPARLLSLVKNIFARPSSPYFKLLRAAGCEFGDVEKLVNSVGVDAALERLARGGVYLTSEEFRGKKDVVRGGASFRVSAAELLPLERSPGFVTQSSGSTRAPLRVVNPLAGIETTVKAVFFAAHGLAAAPYAIYEGTPLTSGGVREVLAAAKIRLPIERWFARELPHKSLLHAGWSRLNTRLFVMAARSVVPGVPFPESVDNEKPAAIVRWLAEKTRDGKSCCLRATASNAARVAGAAQEMRVGLEGAVLVCTGEPLTDAKRRTIERTGARPVPRCGFEEGGVFGYGCAAPSHSDDMHVVETHLAVIQQPEPITVDGSSLRPLLFTSLHVHPRKLLLNVQNGDFAALERRSCGCALGEAGLDLHMHELRSFEKFTTAGMNYHYFDLYTAMEKTLPEEFGGGPGDYQLLEEEDGAGQTRLTLRVHPRIGTIDEGRVLAKLREVMAQGPMGNRFMTELWQGNGVFRLAREAPHATPRGKVLPLHVSPQDGKPSR